MSNERFRGRVKWFSDAKGYGFIERPDQADTFVHYSNIQMEGHKTLQPAQEVEFSIEIGQKGPEAQAVEVIG